MRTLKPYEKLLRDWRPFLRIGRHFIIQLVLVLYSLVGGIIFTFVENKFKLLESTGLLSMESNVTEKTQFLLAIHNKCLNISQRKCADMFEQFILVNSSTIVEGPDVVEHWDFWQGLVYAITIYTTIGYGNISCSSTAGRICTIVYAIVGIPLLFLVIGDLGKLVYIYSSKLWFRTKQLFLSGLRRLSNNPTKVGSRKRGRSHVSHTTGQFVPEERISLKLALALQLTFNTVVALVFWKKESWDFMTSFYFVFISVTTIGLGDFVPSENLLLSYLPILVGLTMISISVNSIHSSYRNIYSRLLRKLENAILKLYHYEFYAVEANRQKLRHFAKWSHDQGALPDQANQRTSHHERVNAPVNLGVFQIYGVGESTSESECDSFDSDDVLEEGPDANQMTITTLVDGKPKL